MTTNPDTKSAQENAADFSDKKRTIALIIVAIAFVMDLLDSTIVNIAIPSIKSNLAASYSAIQWVIAGYSLAFALLLVTGGRMGDVFGYKKLFMLGVGGFTIASLLSGLSQDPSMLIVARLIQGSMAALMVPQVMSLMQIMYKPSERGAINGLFGALGGISASLGPVVAGLLIKANIFGLDWRPIFLINIPIGLFAFFAGLKYLPNGKSAHPLRLDVIGTIIIMIAMLLLVYPLIQGREYNWPIWSFMMLIASLPCFIVFILWQLKKDKRDGSALVLPSLFKRLSFGVGLSVNFVFEMAIIGFFLTFGLLLQIGLGFSPIHAALTGLPVAVGIGTTMAILGGTLIPKLGRYAISVGTILLGLGLTVTTIVLKHYGMSVHSWQCIPGLFLIGIGMGFVFATLFAAVLNGVDPRHAGSASGVLNAVQQVGAAIGVAVIGVIFFGQLSSASTTSFRAVAPNIQATLSSQNISLYAQGSIISSAEKCFVDRSKEKDSSIVPVSCSRVASVNSYIAQTISHDAEVANATNFNNAFKWSSYFDIALLIVTFFLAFLLPAKFRAEAYAVEG
jgi:EmrB/QacA subfamily drug resistance transporter